MLERLRAKPWDAATPTSTVCEDIRARLERELQDCDQTTQAVQPLSSLRMCVRAETLDRYATGPNAAKGIHAAIAGVAGNGTR